MKKLLVANWKMNPGTPKEALGLFGDIISNKDLSGVDLAIAAPFVYLTILHKSNPKIKLGAQNVFWEDGGSFTGEVSPVMLKSVGVSYVIIGHSERRIKIGETDEMVNKKIWAALAAGLKVVLCVGEPSNVREKGISVAKQYVKNQLLRDLRGIPSSRLQIPDSLIVAYEPVWAIGTGVPDGPEGAQEMIVYIRKIINTKHITQSTKVLYGGSVNGKNAASFLKYKDIDGALIGGASLNRKEFNKIIKNVSGL